MHYKFTKETGLEPVEVWQEVLEDIVEDRVEEMKVDAGSVRERIPSLVMDGSLIIECDIDGDNLEWEMKTTNRGRYAMLMSKLTGW